MRMHTKMIDSNINLQEDLYEQHKDTEDKYYGS